MEHEMWSAEVKTLDQGIMDHTIPTIQLTPLEQEAFTTALRASRFDEHDVLAEQIERDQGRLALTKDTTVDILNTFDSSGTVAPEPMKRVVEHARAEYERRRYANINIDSAGEDDIRRRLDAQEAKAAMADLALQTATANSLFLTKLAAFEDTWAQRMGTAEVGFQLWEPDVGEERPSIGVSRLDADEHSTVRVTLDPVTDRADTTTFAGETATAVDLATAARMLRMPAPEVRAVLDAAAAGLRAASQAGAVGSPDAAAADLALQEASQTETAERRLADVRDALSRSGVQGWQADDFGYADQVVAGEQHRF